MSLAPSAAIDADSLGSAGGWRVPVVAIVLTLAAVGAYWNSFNVPFLLDDSLSIGDNPSIRHLGRIGDVLSPPTTALTAARPLLNLTFALNYAVGGLSVQGYHVVNLIIHICAGLALLGIVRRTLLLPGLRQRYGEAALSLAACVALLWTLHPLQTEAVTYISQRAESLMGLFYLLTLYGFIRSVTTESRNGWLILSVAACFCGMATKQVMVTAPVLVLLYDRAFVSGSFRSALTNRRWYYVSVAAAWLLLGLLMHQSSLVAVSVGFHAGVGWPAYGLTELRVVTEYLALSFWPHPLVFDYGSEILATDPLTVVPYALIIAAILAGVAIAWRRSPMAGFPGCWFFLILAPTSTVVPIAAQPMAESRMYLPLAAVVVLGTLWGYSLGQRKTLVVLGLVAVGFGVLTIRRNYDYHSELSIWEDTVARCPHNSRGHYSLGQVFGQMPGRLLDAVAHYEEALRLDPAYAEAHNNLANALAQIPGRLPDAIAHGEEALRLYPAYAEAHNNLANLLAQIPGRLPDALAHYEEALRNKPDYAEAHSNLAMVMAQMPGRLADAVTHGQEALRLKPDSAETHCSLGVALAQMPGRMPDAIAHFEGVVRLKPDFVEARCSLAMAYAETGQLEAAIEQLEIAARLDPTSTAIRDNLEKLKAMNRPDFGRPIP